MIPVISSDTSDSSSTASNEKSETGKSKQLKSKLILILVLILSFFSSQVSYYDLVVIIFWGIFWIFNLTYFSEMHLMHLLDVLVFPQGG